MKKFTNEELIWLAELSSLKLYKNEIPALHDQLVIALDYIKQLDQFEVSTEYESVRPINVFREDKAIAQDSTKLLAEAPKTESKYFVVPKILDTE